MKNKTKLSTAFLIGSAVIGATNCEAQVEILFLDYLSLMFDILNKYCIFVGNIEHYEI